jgi:hypothetical protein
MINKILLSDDTTEVTGIVYGSFHYKANCGSSGPFRVGGIYGSYIEFDLFKPLSVTINIDDTIKYYQTVDVTNTFAPTTPNDHFVNDFIVKEITSGDKKVHIAAYDNTIKLDVDFSKRLKELAPNFPMTIQALVAEAATVAGVTTNMSSGATPYQMLSTVQYFYSDGITVRDIFNYAAEIYCGLGRAVATGNVDVSGIHTLDQAQGWLNSVRYIIAPDDGNYAQSGNYDNNVWYKEGSLQKGTAPAPYDALRIVASDGTILGACNSVQNPSNYYYVTKNVLIDNIISFPGTIANWNGLAIAMFNGLGSAFGNDGTFVPTKVKIFPFRMPYVIGSVACIVDAAGNRTTFPIMSIDLSEDGVDLEGYGSNTETSHYGTNYSSSEQTSTLLATQIDALSRLVNVGLVEFIVDQNFFREGSWVGRTVENSLYNGKRVDLFIRTTTTVVYAYFKLTFPNGTDTGFLPVYNYDGTAAVPVLYQSGQVVSMTYISGLGWVIDRWTPLVGSGTPADLGAAAIGTSDRAARADHVHKKPTADDLSVVDIMCGTELTDGTNLNNLGFGVYHCQTAATAATLVNSPSSNNGFRLEVKQTIESSSRITQIAYLNNVQRIFYRNLTSVGWTSWILLAGTVTSSPTMAQNMGTLSTGSIRKSGNVVHLNMYVTGTTIGTSVATLATIPSDYYPPTSVYGVAVIGVGPDVAFMEVTTEGNVRIRGGAAQSGVNIRLGMTWILT